MRSYERPQSLAQALALRARRPELTPAAGCTDLFARVEQRPPAILDVTAIPELRTLELTGDPLRIGAGVSFATLRDDAGIATQLPALADCARELGAPQIQSRATLGGNLQTCSPVGDALPVLLVLDARVVLASSRATRTIPLAQFITGYRSTALAADELLLAVEVPRPPAGQVQTFRKVGTRRAQSIAKVSLAACATPRAEAARKHTGRGESRRTVAPRDVRIALGAVADRPLRVPAVERFLEGKALDPAGIEAARCRLLASIEPIDDARSTARYRRRVAGNLLVRFLESLAVP